MPLKPPDFDVAAAHRYFAAKCFNDAWDLIEKPDRTAEDDRRMVALSQASFYHWLEREDWDERRLAIGYWQISRVQALTGNAAEAVRMGELCLSHSRDLAPFHLGYAHEALARAYGLAGDQIAAARHLALAKAQAARVEAGEDRGLLEADLKGLE
jgi:hypothetical protein